MILEKYDHQVQRIWVETHDLVSFAFGNDSLWHQSDLGQQQWIHHFHYQSTKKYVCNV